MTPEPADATRRRGYAAALLLLAAGSILLLVGFGLTWAHATVDLAVGVAGATKDVELTGRDLLPLAAACGWVGLAGLAGIVATRSWGRTIVGVVVLAAGVSATVSVLVFVVRSSEFIRSVTEPVSATVAPGWIVALAGGLCASAAAIWTLVRGRGWPTMGARYQRQGAQRTRSAWDLQDMGQDPTDDLVE